MLKIELSQILCLAFFWGAPLFSQQLPQPVKSPKVSSLFYKSRANLSLADCKTKASVTIPLVGRHEADTAISFTDNSGGSGKSLVTTEINALALRSSSPVNFALLGKPGTLFLSLSSFDQNGSTQASIGKTTNIKPELYSSSLAAYFEIAFGLRILKTDKPLLIAAEHKELLPSTITLASNTQMELIDQSTRKPSGICVTTFKQELKKVKPTGAVLGSYTLETLAYVDVDILNKTKPEGPPLLTIRNFKVGGQATIDQKNPGQKTELALVLDPMTLSSLDPIPFVKMDPVQLTAGHSQKLKQSTGKLVKNAQGQWQADLDIFVELKFKNARLVNHEPIKLAGVMPFLPPASTALQQAPGDIAIYVKGSDKKVAVVKNVRHLIRFSDMVAKKTPPAKTKP